MLKLVGASLAGAAIVLFAAFWFLPGGALAMGCAGQYVRASYYGAESGHTTAAGVPFDGTQLLVAHKSLPFGTRLRLSYRGRSIIVPVEDRGPYIAGRTLDLSRAVAAYLGTIPVGVATICMERMAG